jgi:putative phosphoribosyl transferase
MVRHLVRQSQTWGMTQEGHMMFGRLDRFENRKEAGVLLARELIGFAAVHPLILALPRGGVPVAFEVARALDAQLDLLIVRKIGAPGHEEFGIGAVVDGASPQLVLNEDICRQLGVSQDYIRAETQRQLAEIERRRAAYNGGKPPPEIEGRTVIVVDDGIATGGTMKAALRGIRKAGPARLILAVPVAPPSTVRELEAECDEAICLTTPEPFGAVGAFYRDFRQTGDDEVIALLEEARAFGLKPVKAARA